MISEVDDDWKKSLNTLVRLIVAFGISVAVLVKGEWPCTHLFSEECQNLKPLMQVVGGLIVTATVLIPLLVVLYIISLFFYVGVYITIAVHILAGILYLIAVWYYYNYNDFGANHWCPCVAFMAAGMALGANLKIDEFFPYLEIYCCISDNY